MSLEALTLVRVECVPLSFVMALVGRQTADSHPREDLSVRGCKEVVWTAPPHCHARWYWTSCGRTVHRGVTWEVPPTP